MLISKNKQQVIIVTGAVLLMVMLVAFWYLPIRRKSSDFKNKAVSLNSLILQAKNKWQKLPELEEELSHIQQSLEKYELALPQDTQLGEFLGEVARLMDSHGLTEQQITPQQEIRMENLSCIAVQMKCTGSLNQMHKFYHDIQNLDRVVRVEEFGLTNDRDLTGNITMETKVIIYFRGEKA